MATPSIPATSVEYVHVTVTSDAAIDDASVELCFLAGSKTPTGDEWLTAAWADAAVQGVDDKWRRTCRLLIGPGTDYEPAKGTVSAFVRVHDTPEAPVRPAGRIKFT